MERLRWADKLLARANRVERKGQLKLAREYRALAIELQREYIQQDNFEVKYIKR
jgi:hypothetical protein